MGIFKTLKKSLISDSVVVVLIILVVLIYAWVSGAGSVGWDIKKKTEKISGEEQTISENIYIHKKGALELSEASLLFDSSMDLSLWLEGESSLKLEDSGIDTDENPYTISAYSEDGKSPSIELKDSSLYGHWGVFLRDNSKLTAKDSSLGKVTLLDRSELDMNGGSILLSFDSEKSEEYENLEIGEYLSFELESREGWEISVEESEVEGYQINLDDGDDISLINSEGVYPVFNFEGVGKGEEKFSLPTPSVSQTGELDKYGIELVWEDTIFENFGFVLNDSEVSVISTKIGNLVLSENSKFTAGDSEINCQMCRVYNSEIIFDNVTPTSEFTITLYGDSSVVINGSDISDVTIVLEGTSDLNLENCIYEEDNIENNGTGEVTIL